MAGQCSRRCPGRSSTVIPSTPGLPRFPRTRASARLQLLRSQARSIHCSSVVGLSSRRPAVCGSVPSPVASGASPPPSTGKASTSWMFCRIPLTRNAVLLAPPSVQAFAPCGATMPSADFCRPVRSDYSSPSPEFRTDDRSPEVSSTAFSAQPPDLQPVSLMDLDFVVIRRLVRRRLPRIRFLSIGSRLCSTLPSDPASRRRPCASLGLHLHQVVQGTSTLKLPNMLGTPIGIGGSLTAPPLPHHRTYGSVYGGSNGDATSGSGVAAGRARRSRR